jgi:hypothetical protein
VDELDGTRVPLSTREQSPHDVWWRSGPSPCTTCTQGESREAAALRSLGPSFFPMRLFGADRAARPVRYLLVAMEPSAGWVKRYLKQGKSLADAVNFGGAKPGGDSVLQFAAREWLCSENETFLLTDIAKCAVINSKKLPAARTARWRWDNCGRILEQEAQLFQLKAVVAVGAAVREGLRDRKWVDRLPVYRVLHFSNVAASHRDRILTSNEERAVDDPTVSRYCAFVRERQVALRARGVSDERIRVSASTRLLLAVYRKQFADIRRAMVD